MENSSSEETANTSYEYDYEYDEVCDKKNVARIGSIAVPLVFSLVILLSLVGNILVLVVPTHTPHYSLIRNLAISDLIFTAGLPFWSCQFIWGWTFGDVMCKGVSFVFSVGFYSGIVFLILITLQRYVLIVYPLILSEVRQKLIYRAAIFVAWVASIALAVPALFQSSVVSDTDDPNTLYCMHKSSEAKLAATYQQNIIFVVAFLIFFFCYMRICQKISTSELKLRVLRVIACIVMFFFIGWAPYNIVMFLQSRRYYYINDFTDCNASDNLDYAVYVCTLLAFSHCCLNPVLYAFTGVKLRRVLQHICPQIYINTQQA